MNNSNTSTTSRVSASAHGQQHGIEIDIEDKDEENFGLDIGIGPVSRKDNESANNHVQEEPSESNRDKDATPPKKKSKSGHNVNVMMSLAGSGSSSTGTTGTPTPSATETQGSFSSLSSSSPCAADDLHLVNVANIAPAWKNFKKYNLHFHPNMEGRAHCILCGVNIKIRAGNTSSMNKHLSSKHRSKWEEVMNPNPIKSGTQMCMDVLFPKKIKEKTTEELREEFTNATTNFVIENCMPFTIVASKAFRNLFIPFHKNADQITKISANRVREAIFERGALAKKATLMEVSRFKGSWTCDHWTGKDGATYTTTTFHYIKNWSLRSIVVDFKVFHGTTSGEAIYNDQVKVLEEYTTVENIVIGITDTTSSMGVLGQFLRLRSMQHAYCTDHNLQCNAILAFNGKSTCQTHKISTTPDPTKPLIFLSSKTQIKIFRELIMPCQKQGRLLNTFPSQHSRLQSYLSFNQVALFLFTM